MLASIRTRIAAFCLAVTLGVTLNATAVDAQVRDGVFVDYAFYDRFVTQTVSAREFETLIIGLGAVYCPHWTLCSGAGWDRGMEDAEHGKGVSA